MNNLSASKFSFTSIYLRNDLEYILSKISDCYNLMLKDYSIIENDENLIRNRLQKDYLDNNEVRNKLSISEFLFDTETELINDDYSVKGRTDIKVYSAIERLKDTSAYHIIECKRLDGKKPLNDAYFNNGIDRFITEKYPIYKNLNGMIGFVVAPIDIDLNSSKLNLTKQSIGTNIKYSYTSSHKTKSSKQDFSIYHVMLDFSSKIK